MNTTIRRHITNVLTAAVHGDVATDDDVAGLPAVLAEWVRSATSRIVAHAAAGNRNDANTEHAASLRDLESFASQHNLDLNAAVNRAAIDPSTVVTPGGPHGLTVIPLPPRR